MCRFFLILAFLLSVDVCFAQDEVVLDQYAANSGFNAAINAVTLFTSQNTISSGNFNFDSDQGTDHANITHLPYTHQFEALKDGTIPEISFVLGSSKVTNSVPVITGPGIDDFSRLETTSIGFGWGLSIPVVEQIVFIPRMFIAYSHIERKYDFNNEFSQTNLQQFDKDVFNTWFDVMTYTPSVELRYDFPANPHGIASGENVFTARTRYSQLFNNSISSKSDVVDINSNTGHWQTTLEALLPVGRRVYDFDLLVHPFIVRSDIYGAARQALGFSYFHEIGAELVFSDPKAPWFLSGFSLGGSYSFGDNFDGWRIGLGFGLPY